MAQETLPSPDTGAAIAEYRSKRKRVVGREMLKSGGKAVAVGLFAAGAVLLSGVITVTAPLGFAVAGGLATYGGIKAIEGGVKRARS